MRPAVMIRPLLRTSSLPGLMKILVHPRSLSPTTNSHEASHMMFAGCYSALPSGIGMMTGEHQLFSTNITLMFKQCEKWHS